MCVSRVYVRSRFTIAVCRLDEIEIYYILEVGSETIDTPTEMVQRPTSTHDYGALGAGRYFGQHLQIGHGLLLSMGDGQVWLHVAECTA